tara:strand:- start:13121 stop:13450 length:330 start_codon:yes stop_codon:yes gene_type:complete
MPRVLLRRTWFAPTDVVKVDRLRTMAGHRFRRGEQDIPEEYMDYIPSDAEVLDENAPAAPATPVEETEHAHEESIADASDDIETKQALFRAELEAEAKPKKRGRPRKES